MWYDIEIYLIWKLNAYGRLKGVHTLLARGQLTLLIDCNKFLKQRSSTCIYKAMWFYKNLIQKGMPEIGFNQQDISLPSYK